jgi:hypothetical protein
VNRETPKRLATSISVNVLLPEPRSDDFSNATSLFGAMFNMIASAFELAID